MADNMCGPSNAAKGLTRHLDQDRSLQRDRHFNGPQDLTQSFRNLRLNPNTEFSSFQQQNATLPGPLYQPLHHLPPTGPQQYPYPHPHIDPLLASDPRDWARQFSQSIPSGAAHHHPGPSSMATGTTAAPANHTWAAQYASFPNYAPNQASQARQAHLSNPILAQSYTPVQYDTSRLFGQNPENLRGLTDNVPGSLEGGPEDFDFDKQMREWYAANNGPETEAEANRWLQVPEATQDQRVEQHSAAAPPADAHQLAESSLNPLQTEPAPVQVEEPPRAEEQTRSQGAQDTDLAVAAQQILNSVYDNESIKFKESSFLKMMRKIAAQDLVVRNNALVDASGASADADDTGAGAGSASRA
ncbi:hypothetical protein GGR52DRAFT_506664 [Hypoxylon sp. FL1284]|nr:hypothetical protein GGR52DRAFT_506664 [Hypoxylon sp. FL1284]